MAVRLDVQAFIRDYCKGVKDRDLVARHHLKGKELVAIVKKLLKDGTITREQYFERNRKIQEVEASKEQEFLKSLSHCLTCGHAQPIPFSVCPACGTEVLERPTAQVAPVPEVAPPAPPPPPTPAPQPEENFSEAERRKLGMALDDITSMAGFGSTPLDQEYIVTEIVSEDQAVTVFKAETSSGDGPTISVRLFHSDSKSQLDSNALVDRINDYQSAMTDPNILTAIGTAALGGDKVALYESVPTSLEDLLTRSPEGLPLQFLIGLLPQLLNAVGYSHMHRGMDGAVRRLAHMFLKPSKFLFDEGRNVLKLADCGVWRAGVDLRGHKNRVWQEPGVDLAALAPECFVVSGRAVNAFLADIYSLGVVLYKLTTGKPAFAGANAEEYSFLHLKTFPVPPRVHRYTVPTWLDAMILKCLEKEPADRWRSATQMELSIRKHSGN